MGWASGTPVIYRTWDCVREYIPDEIKAHVLAQVIEIFEDADWDCQDDIRGSWPEYEEALRIRHPNWFE